MSNTPLTVATATQAGQVAAAIANLQAVIAQLQAAISSNQPIFQISVNQQGVSAPLVVNFVFDEADSSTILNDVLTACENNLSSLNTQLGSF